MLAGKAYFRFLIVFGLFAVTIPFFYREHVLGELLTPLVLGTAKATAALLDSIGIAAMRDGVVISAPSGFAYEIYYRCTGFLPVLCLVVAVLAFPARIWHKVLGLSIGVPILLAFNLIRLVHLFHVGVTRPAFFDIAHEYLWEAAIIVITAGLWIGFVAWLRRAEPARRVSSLTLARNILI